MLNRKQQPPTFPIGEIKIQRPETILLDNGIPLNIFKRNDEDVIRFDIVINAGSWQQKRPLESILANRMLREGTSRYSSKEISLSLDFYGAWLDLSNTHCKSFITLYSLNKYFDKTVRYVHSMLLEANFPQQEFEVLLANRKQQYLINKTKPETIAQKQFLQSIFGESHPFGIVAEEADYNNISTSHLKDYYQKHYHSQNTTFYTSGNVTDDIVKTINLCFGKAPWGTTGEKDIRQPIPFSTSSTKKLLINCPDAIQSSIKVGFASINCNHPDFQKLRVVTTLLGGYFGSRLMSNIREDKGYTYGIGANVVPLPDTSLFVISTEAANEYVVPILMEIKKEIKLLQEKPMEEKELQMVKNYAIGDFCRSFEGMFSLSDAYIMLETYGLNDNYFDKCLQDTVRITPEDVMEIARKYLTIEDMIEVVAGKKI